MTALGSAGPASNAAGRSQHGRALLDRPRVDQSRHYLNRRESEKTLLALLLRHFGELERWSSDLAEGDG
jgi:hypothetical protein